MKRWGRARAGLTVRAAMVVLMVFGVLAGAAGSAAAQRDEGGVDGNVYTGENFEWSVEWDEDAWTLDEADSSGGVDSVMLDGVKGPYVFAVFIARDFDDTEACVDYWFESLEKGAGYDDVTVSDELETLPVSEDGADAAYTYLHGSVAGYAQCRTLEDGEGTLLMVMTAEADAYENRLPIFADLIAGVEGVEQPAAGSGDEDIDDEETVAGSGIDGETYVSPTYGYSVDWSGTDWEVAFDEELVNEAPNGVGLDRILLLGTQGNFYIEGKADYEGDATDCLAGELEELFAADEVRSIVDYVEDGEAVRGRSDGGGRYGAYVLTREVDGDEFEWMAYIECRPLVEDESVVVFTLFTSPDLFEEELDAAQDVIDTLVLEGEETDSSDARDRDEDDVKGILRADTVTGM